MAKAEPWLKFHPVDWRTDVELRCCSLAARGLWIECIALMHLSERYGHLVINGKAMTPAQLAQAAGCSTAEARKLLAELLDNGVAHRTEDGVVYSRRMVRDRAKAEADRANGSGGGNPLVAQGRPQGRAQGVNPKPNRGVGEGVNRGVGAGVDQGVNPGVNGGVNPQTPDIQTYSERSESLQPRARAGVPGGGLQENQTLSALERVGLSVNFQRGGFAKIGKKSAKKFSKSDPDQADARLKKILTGQCGKSDDEAWAIIDAAYDPADPDHHAAATLCERISADNHLGWWRDRRQRSHEARQGETA
jgi:hypothetical protein